MRRWSVGIGGLRLLPGGSKDDSEGSFGTMILQPRLSHIMQYEINMSEIRARRQKL